MDKLKMGSVELQGSVHFTSGTVAGQSVPALELRVEGPVDETALAAMAQGRLEIYGENGLLQGEHTGYNTVIRHSVVLAKVSEDRAQLAEARLALEKLQVEKETLEQENAALLFENLTGEVL